MPSVGLSVGLSGKCIVAKRLIGSGDDWGRSRDVCIRWGGDRRMGRGSFGMDVGRPNVTNAYLFAYLYSRATRLREWLVFKTLH